MTMCANAAQMSSTAAGSASGASEKTTQCTVQRARRSVMVGGNVFGERHRRAPPLQRRRSARPRGTSMGQMGGATRSDDGGRQLGVRAETKGPRGTTTSTGRVGDGAEATRGYQAVAGLTFATKTSWTAVSVPWSTKSVSSTRTSVRTGHVQGGLQRSASAPPRTSRQSTAGPSRARTGF